MEPIKKLNFAALEKRMTKTTTTKEALRTVTPFTMKPSSNETKILVKKDANHV